MRYSKFMTAHMEFVASQLSQKDALILGSRPSERMGRYKYWSIATFHERGHGSNRMLLVHVRILNPKEMVERMAKHIARLSNLKLKKIMGFNSKKERHYYFELV